MIVLVDPDIVIYGGSFDPPHSGHIDCIRHVCARFSKVRVDILPSPSPVKAGGGFKSPCASFVQRLAMCNLAFDRIPVLNQIFVSDLEKTLPEPRYTLQLVEHYQLEHPRKRVALLIGLDQLKAFKDWYKPSEILRICDLIVVKRGHEMAMRGVVDDFCARMGLSIEVLNNGETVLIKESGRFVHLIERDTAVVSSSELRRDLNTCHACETSLLPLCVREYILQNGLYT